jgi:hypothetical protein
MSPELQSLQHQTERGKRQTGDSSSSAATRQDEQPKRRKERKKNQTKTKQTRTGGAGSQTASSCKPSLTWAEGAGRSNSSGSGSRAAPRSSATNWSRVAASNRNKDWGAGSSRHHRRAPDRPAIAATPASNDKGRVRSSSSDGAADGTSDDAVAMRKPTAEPGPDTTSSTTKPAPAARAHSTGAALGNNSSLTQAKNAFEQDFSGASLSTDA